MIHADLDKLFNLLIPFAQQQLEKNGSFYPYAATIGLNQEITMVNLLLGEYPNSTDMIDKFNLILGTEADNHKLVAAGMTFDVKIPRAGDTIDAMQTNLEHENGESIAVYLPYKVIGDSSVEYDDLISQRKPKTWFTQS